MCTATDIRPYEIVLQTDNIYFLSKVIVSVTLCISTHIRKLFSNCLLSSALSSIGPNFFIIAVPLWFVHNHFSSLSRVFIAVDPSSKETQVFLSVRVSPYNRRFSRLISSPVAAADEV